MTFRLQPRQTLKEFFSTTGKCILMINKILQTNPITKIILHSPAEVRPITNLYYGF